MNDMHAMIKSSAKRTVTVLGIAGGLLISLAIAQSDDSLPAGKGRDAVRKMCGGACHELDVVVAERLSKQGWSNIVDTMVSRGATGTDEEIAMVIDYLAEHFGRANPAAGTKINVNTETAKALAADLALTEEEGAAIVQYREKQGKFKNWEDLKKVQGLDLSKIESKKDRVVF